MMRNSVLILMGLALGLFPANGHAGDDIPAGGWPAYGRDPGGARFSPLTQIDRDSVADLEEAWRFRTGDLGQTLARPERLTFEATPILAEGRLYFCTASNFVFAIDPVDGHRIWRFDPEVDPDLATAEVACRGVSFWADDKAPADAVCSTRIFTGTRDGRLIALDAATGRRCAGFGENGAVNLHQDVRPTEPGEYTITSPPAIAGDLVITGSAIGDNRAVDLELGIVRAYDARSGEEIWRWDPIPRAEDDPEHRSWKSEQVARTGAGNAWSILSVDAAADLVFIPTGAPSPDFYGGERLGDNRYANSLVALKASTGEMAWHFQMVHHDLWDYDIPAQPALVTLKRDGKAIPAVLQATKMGMIFSFNRLTGAPVFDIEERPVPQTDVPGEVTSPTQPFPVAPPALVSHDSLTPDDAWGLTFWDKGRCADKLSGLRAEGIYTPPSIDGTVLYPSYGGGINWDGVAFDQDRQILVTSVKNVASAVTLIPRPQLQAARSGDWPVSEFASMHKTPYGMRREPLFSPFGIPCSAPPWGELVAVDMTAGEILWKIPLGNTAELAPIALDYGVPALGGPIVTASGLIFVAGTTDDYIRAFDIETGEALWRAKLPAGGQATPMTYAIDGRQYVVIAAGGHGGLATTRGDYVVAFALEAE